MNCNKYSERINDRSFQKLISTDMEISFFVKFLLNLSDSKSMAPIL